MQAQIAGAVLVLAACAVLAAAGACCLAKWDGRRYRMPARPRAAPLAAAPIPQTASAAARGLRTTVTRMWLCQACHWTWPSRRPVLPRLRTLPGSNQRRPRNPVAERREVTGLDKRDIPTWLEQVVQDAADVRDRRGYLAGGRGSERLPLELGKDLVHRSTVGRCLQPHHRPGKPTGMDSAAPVKGRTECPDPGRPTR